MMDQANNKKYGKRGVGMSFLIITALIILSIGVLGVWMWQSAKPVYAGSQIETCRASISLHETTEGNWPFPSTPRLCSTIYRIKGGEEVPLEKYTQDKRGAGKDIRQMIADCWYMWHEGRPGVMDDSLWDSSTGCRTCFVFKIKEKEKIKNFDEGPPLDNDLIRDLMQDIKPGSGEITSDACAFENTGGFLIGIPNTARSSLGSCSDLFVRPDESDKGKWVETPSKKAVGGKKCCVSSEFPNECENYGGICVADGEPIPAGYKAYKRSCPVKRECYVKDEDYFTYWSYLTQNGGSVLFVPKTRTEEGEFLRVDPNEKMNFNPGEKYAVVYVSPGDDLCPGDGTVCGLRKGLGGWIWTSEKPHLVLVSSFKDAYELGCIEGV